MPRIAINYRRDDTSPWAGRLYDRLTAEFGRDQVFIDIDTLEPGVDFVEEINRVVGELDILVAVIGPKWATIADEDGRRRLDDPGDFVRLEIVAALKREVRVVPVLVGDAVMPSAEELPEDLDALARRHAIEISDQRFHSDVDRLVKSLKGALEEPEVEMPGLVVAARSTGHAMLVEIFGAGQNPRRWGQWLVIVVFGWLSLIVWQIPNVNEPFPWQQLFYEVALVVAVVSGLRLWKAAHVSIIFAALAYSVLATAFMFLTTSSGSADLPPWYWPASGLRSALWLYMLLFLLRLFTPTLRSLPFAILLSTVLAALVSQMASILFWPSVGDQALVMRLIDALVMTVGFWLGYVYARERRPSIGLVPA